MIVVTTVAMMTVATTAIVVIQVAAMPTATASITSTIATTKAKA
jgi:hypothetical protein